MVFVVVVVIVNNGILVVTVMIWFRSIEIFPNFVVVKNNLGFSLVVEHRLSIIGNIGSIPIVLIDNLIYLINEK